MKSFALLLAVAPLALAVQVFQGHESSLITPRDILSQAIDIWSDPELANVDFDLAEIKAPSADQLDSFEEGYLYDDLEDFSDGSRLQKRATNFLPAPRNALRCRKTSHCRERNAFRVPYSSYRCSRIDSKCTYECNAGFRPHLTRVNGNPVWLCLRSPSKCGVNGENSCVKLKNGYAGCSPSGTCQYRCFADSPDRKYRLQFAEGRPFCVDTQKDVDHCGGFQNACQRPYNGGLVSCHAGVCNFGCRNGSKPVLKNGARFCQ